MLVVLVVMPNAVYHSRSINPINLLSKVLKRETKWHTVIAEISSLTVSCPNG
jgi:hypothetical protein